MTPEQLAALMDWVDERITDAVVYEGEDGPRTVMMRRRLYDAFGFEEGPYNEPVAPGTYPPTSGDRTALTP